MKYWLFIIVSGFFFLSGCSYSFTGATVEGKNINIHTLENHAPNVVPTLASTLTTKIKNRILSQTGLTPVNIDAADYDLSGTIVAYTVTVSGVQNTQTATKNRLTISVEINFKNRKNDKQSFKQTFSGSSDFDASLSLQTVENSLIDDIGGRLAEDIFNKAFVNW